jgi:hypothetical protein
MTLCVLTVTPPAPEAPACTEEEALAAIRRGLRLLMLCAGPYEAESLSGDVLFAAKQLERAGVWLRRAQRNLDPASHFGRPEEARGDLLSARNAARDAARWLEASS